MYELNIYTAILRILLAAIAGFVIGFDRFMSGRAAGIRTHIILSVGSALTMIISMYCISFWGYNADVLRIPAGVVSGIGFLGVGTIFVRGQRDVTGLTTAAGLWTTGVIGIGFGAGCYILSAVVTVIVILSITLIKKLDDRLREKQKNINIYVELSDVNYVMDFQEGIKEICDLNNFSVVAPRSAIANNVGIELVVKHDSENEAEKIKNEILKLDNTIFVIVD